MLVPGQRCTKKLSDIQTSHMIHVCVSVCVFVLICCSVANQCSMYISFMSFIPIGDSSKCSRQRI